MSYTTGSHTVFHHRYHIVWITKYRYKVLEGELRDRIRTIIRQVCKELGVQIVSGVLSKEHVHMFVEIPPQITITVDNIEMDEARERGSRGRPLPGKAVASSSRPKSSL